MIVEPVPTNPRSPLRLTLRLAGMVAPALLLVVVVVLAFSLIGLARPLIQDVRLHGGLKRMLTGFGTPRPAAPGR